MARANVEWIDKTKGLSYNSNGRKVPVSFQCTFAFDCLTKAVDVDLAPLLFG
jgi:hypothetical protein